MKEFSQWPTFPQVYIGAEFFGGADIMIGERLPGGCRSAFLAALLVGRLLKRAAAPKPSQGAQPRSA